jgi:hypothetical protein
MKYRFFIAVGFLLLPGTLWAGGNSVTLAISVRKVISLSPFPLSFPLANIGVPSTGTVSITNSSRYGISVGTINFSGTNAGDFTQTNNCGTALAGNSSCRISVTFTPSAGGTRSAKLNFQAIGVGTYTDAVSGSGVSGTPVSFSPSSLTFAAQTVGTTSSPQTDTITNVSGEWLPISSIAVSGVNAGDFAQTNSCVGPAAANGTCPVSVSFTPTAAGTRRALLSFQAVSGGQTYTMPLSGTGTAGSIRITNVTLSCGSNCTFTPGVARAIGSATAPLSSGSFAGTWSLQTSGTDHAGTTCNNYGSDFSIDSSTGVLSNSNGAPAQSYPGVCVIATQSGVSNSPYVQAFTLTGTSIIGGAEEFVGPFANWTNVKTTCGAVGDGSQDDTSAIQTCLNRLSSGSSVVIWFPAGTYKITSTLSLSATQHVAAIWPIQQRPSSHGVGPPIPLVRCGTTKM